jgi:molybdate transport system ATP-binding protein
MIEIDIKKSLHGAEGEMLLDVHLCIKEQEFVLLRGKSGSGKTTLLRILAGLEEAEGTIMIGDTIWQKGSKKRAVQKRELGFVFQDYALFPHMSVEENLHFVAKDNALADHLLAVTELSSLRHKLPHMLSGGQQQRVSLCRAMMKRPKLLLMDEPFSALDGQMRLKLQEELLILHKEFKTTTIMISHDVAEIYRLADRVLVLENGEIIEDRENIKEEGNFFESEVVAILEGMVVVVINHKVIKLPLPEKGTMVPKVGELIKISTDGGKLLL